MRRLRLLFSSFLLLASLLSTRAFAQTAAPPPAGLAPLPAAPSAGPAEAPAVQAPSAPPDANAAPVAAPPAAAIEVARPTPEEPLARLRRPRHDGFYFGFGSGAGYVGAWGNGPNGSASIASFGSTSTLAVGGTPAPGLALAGMIEGGMTTGTFNGGPTISATTTHVVNGKTVTTAGGLSGHASAAMFLLGLEADWYPNPTDGWHVGGALGLGGGSVTDDANNVSTGISVAGSLFGGYQWWLGPSWSLGLMAVVTGMPTLKMSDSNGDDTGYRLTPLALSIQSLLLYY